MRVFLNVQGKIYIHKTLCGKKELTTWCKTYTVFTEMSFMQNDVVNNLIALV